MGSFRKMEGRRRRKLGIQLKGEGKSVDRGIKLDEGKMKGVDESSVKELS